MTATATAQPRLRWPMLIGCHTHTVGASAAWVANERVARLGCSACGSIHPGSLYRLLAAVRPTPPPWERTSGADRAYAQWQGVFLASLVGGWPRRLHVLDQGVQLLFDARHLTDLPDAEFAAVTEVIARHAGVQFGTAPDGRLTYTGVTA